MSNESITTQLSISNNDIVTMLLEEKKEQLRNEIIRLTFCQTNILEKYVDEMATKLKEFYLSPKFVIFRGKCYEFAKLYNPDIEIKIVLGNEVSPEEEIRKFFSYYRSADNIIISPSGLHLVVVNEEDEENLDFWDEGQSYIEYPSYLRKEFKLKVSDEDREEYKDISMRISKYENELRNTNGLKDQMVAKMTKAAILNNPDLIAIRDSVLKLE